MVVCRFPGHNVAGSSRSRADEQMQPGWRAMKTKKPQNGVCRVDARSSLLQSQRKAVKASHLHGWPVGGQAKQGQRRGEMTFGRTMDDVGGEVVFCVAALVELSWVL